MIEKVAFGVMSSLPILSLSVMPRAESVASLHAFSITAIHCWQRSAQLVLTMAPCSCEKPLFHLFVGLCALFSDCELISRSC